MGTTQNHYILILCGGSGPRLWPLSRSSHPKQFLKLFDEDSLLEDTINRFKNIVPSENIFLISQEKYLPQIKKITHGILPSSNLIGEPLKKNTAMAILFASSIIHQKNPNAIITSAPSDHFIKDKRAFKEDLQQAANIASKYNKIVTLGVRPTYPNPGFGYILTSSKSSGYYNALKFIEKPTVVDAKILIRKDAVWNSGIYTFTSQGMLNEFSIHQKDLFEISLKLLKNLKNPKSILRLYKSAINISIDKAISEKSGNLAMIHSHFLWSDVGEWKSIWEKLFRDDDGIARIGKNTDYVHINSKNCLLHTESKKVIGMVGVNNLAIIDTPDALLVCDLNDSFSVRDLVGKIVADRKLKAYFLSKNDK